MLKADLASCWWVLMSHGVRQFIAVRSLAESDLGLFAAHRTSARSKQRAININADIAKRLLSPSLYNAQGTSLNCVCTFGTTSVSSVRHFGKIHKNWRLGGSKIDGEPFSLLDSKDFLLIRSTLGNDGSHPVLLTFISKKVDRVVHAGIAAIVEKSLKSSMVSYEEGQPGFSDLAKYCAAPTHPTTPVPRRQRVEPTPLPPIPPMPREPSPAKRPRTIQDKLRNPHVLERMLQVSADLSAPAQLRFIETVRSLAEQLRAVLLATNGIVRLERNHSQLWRKVAGMRMGFVDGGLANLSMLGSAPIAARVGGYVVTPGERGPDREHFTMVKHLIDELYSHEESGVYTGSFPDIGALRDAARISVEAAGAIQLLKQVDGLRWIMVHGALVNPVSRYSDVMQEGKVRHRFPNFSPSALTELLPGESQRTSRDANFISVHLRQLQLLAESQAIVCGVIERESSTNSVCRAVLDNLDDFAIRDLLPLPPQQWKQWFRSAVDPSDDEAFEGQRITDSLLFRCVLEPGEALAPVVIDRNDLRRAPEAWSDVVAQYPKPRVSYLAATEWSAPIRVEFFEKDLASFEATAELVLHCALLLPGYAFPVGLDIVDKYARIPDWMSRPINTRTAVIAMRRALDAGDSRLFDSLRRMLCGSGREWLLRPGIFR